MYALAWQAEQEARCLGCGHLREESMSAANDGQYVVETVTCFACRAKQLEMKRDQRDEDTKTEGRYYLAMLDGE